MIDRGLNPGDSEMIATFLDGRLSESERREFMERLDRDEALYEVFVESVRYREARGGEGARVVEHPAANRWRYAIPASIAALLAIAVALPLLLREGGLLGDAYYAQALLEGTGLEGSLEEGWIEQGWSVTRGVSTVQSEVDSAFRVGVHAVDLEIALRLGRIRDAEQLLRMIDRELNKIDLSDQLQLSYDEIRKHLEMGLPLEQALELAASVDPQASELLGVGYGYAFGKWAEAGKLAARTGNRDLLRSRGFRRTLREIREHDWTEVANERLGVIATQITDRGTELDMKALEAAFTTLINES